MKMLSKCSKKCLTCDKVLISDVAHSAFCKKSFTKRVTNPDCLPACKLSNLIYLITCEHCGLQYVGQTKRSLCRRFIEHRFTFRKRPRTLLGAHFHNTACSEKYNIQILETLNDLNDEVRIKRENFWIRQLLTQKPYGLNYASRFFDKLDTTYNSCLDSAHTSQTSQRSQPKRGKRKNRSDRQIRPCANDIVWKFHRSFANNPHDCLKNIRHQVFTWDRVTVRMVYYEVLDRFTSPIDAILKDLCLYRINTIHKLRYRYEQRKERQKPVRNNITVKFNNRLFDHINLNRCFSLGQLSNEAEQFKISRPRVVFTYTIPLGPKTFNYKHTVMNTAKLDNWDSLCGCKQRPGQFIHNDCNHIVTCNTAVLEHTDLVELFDKGAKFRSPDNINTSDAKMEIIHAKNKLIDRIIRKKPQSKHLLYELSATWNNNIEKEFFRYDNLKPTPTSGNYNRYDTILKTQPIKKLFEDIQRTMVITTTDKASQNFSFICKKFYLAKIKEILEDPSGTYQMSTFNPDSCTDHIKNDIKNLNLDIKTGEDLPFIHILPKYHKTPLDFRTIIASKKSVIKPLSIAITIALTHIMHSLKSFCKYLENSSGINCYWIIDNHLPILNRLNGLSKVNKAESIFTYDFQNMYTKLLHCDIIDSLRDVIHIGYGRYQHLYIGDRYASWTDKKNYLKVTKQQLLDMIIVLLNNLFFQFGNNVFRQIVGIPMGTNCAPLLANLTLFRYEYRYITRKLKLGDYEHCKLLSDTFRYMDDLSSINDRGTFQTCYKDIYPASLTLKKINSDPCHAEVLDIDIRIVNNKFITTLFKKQFNLNFRTKASPDIMSCISNNCKYNFLLGGLFRIKTICSDTKDIEVQCKKIIDELISNGYNRYKLAAKLQKFMAKHPTLNLKMETIL